MKKIHREVFLLKRRHPILTALLVLLCLVVLAFSITGVVIMHGATADKGEFQYLLVLGTVVKGTEPSAMLSDRIQGAYDYLTAHPDTICIVSGGKGDEVNLSEAECMYNELVEMGIDPARILMEDRATSTVENFQFSLALIEEETGTRPEKLGVLSSEFHLFRARMFARDEGVMPIAIPAHTSDTATFVTYLLREIPLVWYYGLIA